MYGISLPYIDPIKINYVGIYTSRMDPSWGYSIEPLTRSMVSPSKFLTEYGWFDEISGPQNLCSFLFLFFWIRDAPWDWYFTYMYHKFVPTVNKYTIHGAYGNVTRIKRNTAGVYMYLESWGAENKHHASQSKGCNSYRKGPLVVNEI